MAAAARGHPDRASSGPDCSAAARHEQGQLQGAYSAREWARRGEIGGEKIFAYLRPLDADILAPDMVTPKPRQAGRRDLATVVSCTRAAYEKFVSRLGYEPKPMGTDYSGWIDEGWVWIVESDQGVVGTLVLLPENERLLIYSVAVAPEHQSQGHGRALLAFAEARARCLGLSRIVLYTNEKMTENIQFYEALGYARYDRQPHPRVAGSWVIYMDKTVSPE